MTQNIQDRKKGTKVVLNESIQFDWYIPFKAIRYW